ncbi:MAG: heme-degrading domain-containing protein [Brevinematales bacterium]|jgi:uncharacterized protein (UPF0303 family)
MNKFDALLKKLEKEEKDLRFTEFTSETALAIGLNLIEAARKNNKIITIDITRNSHQLFHYSFEGTSPDNDQWIIRKNRVAVRFGRSSYRMGTMLRKEGKKIEEVFFVDPFEYSPHGGAFPIIIKNAGVIGTITVSGLAQEEDHEMVVSALREYLKEKL